jgi:glyoxylate reductase
MADRPVMYATREIPERGMASLENHCDLHLWEKSTPPPKPDLIERLMELNPDGLLCLLTDEIDAEVMDSAPALRAISTFSVGYDHVDIGAAINRDIAVGHTPSVLTETTADLAWALLMACARRVVEGQQYVSDDEWETWQPTLLMGPDIHGATLGIVGLGKIGTAVARRSAGFDMSVIYTGTEQKAEREQELAAKGIEAEHVSHEQLFERSDFVSIHVPLTVDTHHLVGESELSALGSDGVLVNTSRGEVVDSVALERVLSSDSLFAAGLDVTDPEPLPADHELGDHFGERLLVTPHIGSASLQTRNQMAEMAVENLKAGLSGETLPNSAVEDRRC